ncbi:MAG: alkaline phosphatase family protein [Candidatus Bathyarchaeota archaeon]|nr:alkaline phosphatase family protein [Candidatus Bathyarchaeota archaeon]
MRKLLYVVLDGLGDRPSPSLNWKTPLEAAETLNMDFLAKNGKTGLMFPIRKGFAPESDTAVISILGYDPLQYPSSRGVLEVYGVGLKIEDGMLALRCNFACVDDEWRIVDRRGGGDLTFNEALKLAESVNREIKLLSEPAEFIFKNTVGYRGVLIIKRLNGKLSGKISNVDPAYVRIGDISVAKAEGVLKVEKCKPLDSNVETILAANLVNEFTEKSFNVLSRHEVNVKRISEGKLPANIILSRDAGSTVPRFPSFEKLYNINFGFMAEMPVERGIAILCGMIEIPLPPSTGNLREDYELRAKRVLESIENLDGVYIHIKGPDEPGHKGKCREKMEIISLIDRYFFGRVLPNLNLKETVVVVTADHSTPCTVRAHTDDPVPLLIAGGDVTPDGISSFSEKACAKGSLGLLNGSELMPKLINLIRR